MEAWKEQSLKRFCTCRIPILRGKLHYFRCVLSGNIDKRYPHGWIVRLPYVTAANHALILRQAIQILGHAQSPSHGMRNATRPSHAKQPPKLVLKLNYCSATDLVKLPRIGRKRAEQIIAHRAQHGPFFTVEDLQNVPGLTPQVVECIADNIDWTFSGHDVPPPRVLKADARHLSGIALHSIDLIVTSPPYWKKRDYKHPRQIGQEATPQKYVDTLVQAINEWKELLRPHGSIFLNIGDTYLDGELVGIPDLLCMTLRKQHWHIVNEIIWAKNNGVPERLPYRLANRHEVILQITKKRKYFADAPSLAQYLGQWSNPGDVWSIPHGRDTTEHLAPFPEELARRIILFSSPEHVCSKCGKPFFRRWLPTADLNPTRPQAKRAIELFQQAGLTEEHLRAIRAVGISDAGKGRKVQTGSSANAKRTQQLARQAKKALGGYFREFTFARKKRADWVVCSCHAPTVPGTVLDPFMGSGTTLRAAYQLGRIAIGADLLPKEIKV